MKYLRFASLVVVCCLAISITASAQKKSVALTPYIGVMVPLGDVVRADAIAAGSPVAEHNIDLLFGGELSYWWSQKWGAELGVMYAPNAIDSDAFGVPGKVDATFLTVSARLLYDFGNDPTKPSFFLSSGLGFFVTNYDAPLDMTTGGMGLLGLGLNIPMSSAVAVRIDVTDYLTATNWELSGGGETSKLLQNDLTVKGGLTFSF